MTASPLDKKRFRALAEALASLDNVQDVQEFLLDLCTPAELESLGDRWLVAKWLQDGENYRTISEKTKVSTTTITRVGRALKYGTGGYQKALIKAGRGDAK